MTGCYAAKPMVWMGNDVSVPTYIAFEVLPVTNATEKTFDLDVARYATHRIESSLKDNGYVITNGTAALDDILVIKSSLGLAQK